MCDFHTIIRSFAMIVRVLRILLLAVVLVAIPFVVSAASTVTPQKLQTRVNDTIEPLMKRQDIAGMAVAVIYAGKPYFFYYGVADINKKRSVTDDTLFELGSISKTFTGIAGGYAVQSGMARLSDPAAKYSPALKGSQWSQVSLLHLATYTAGGLPLQLPHEVIDEISMWRYYNGWQPESTPGTMRSYSNASMGLFGRLIVAKSGLSFEQFMQQKIFQPMKLKHTYITVADAEKNNYAFGYRKGKPIRVMPGMLDAEAYGIKATIKDMATFMQANITPGKLNSSDAVLAKAITIAQTGYFKAGDMYQGLGFEMYPWPIDSQQVIACSNNDIALKASAAELQSPPRPMTSSTWLHKTGSTNGFGAYIAFIPEKRLGIVILANKNYPDPDRVTAAWRILDALQ